MKVLLSALAITFLPTAATITYAFDREHYVTTAVCSPRIAAAKVLAGVVNRKFGGIDSAEIKKLDALWLTTYNIYLTSGKSIGYTTDELVRKEKADREKILSDFQQKAGELMKQTNAEYAYVSFYNIAIKTVQRCIKELSALKK